MSGADNAATPRDDPFRAAREDKGVLHVDFQGESVPMILRHADVRAAAADWRSFSSDAPFRVPIPSEEDVRSVRQLPIEVDPPDHREYRKVTDPFFARPKDPGMVARVDGLIQALIGEAARRERVEIVREFALPLQSRALAYLLNVPESEAEEWIGWGIHVFRDGGDGSSKGAALEDYIHRRLDHAAANPGDDFFSALSRATFRGRPLTREEQAGFANLAFAGGRDTIIQSVAAVFAILARQAGALDRLREDPKRIQLAVEEVFRVATPLTHIGRVCPHAGDVQGAALDAGQRVSLCWASANRDEVVFDDPGSVRLDRKPNPHLAFGSGPHTCQGAPHARLIVRNLLRQLAEQVARIHILSAEEHVEQTSGYARLNGFEELVVRIERR
jgi:cytochrome P450